MAMPDLAPTTLFPHTPHPAPIDDRLRIDMLRDPGFGRVFTDHMAIMRWTEGRGWHSHSIEARRPLEIDPACAVLHYAQEIFEGMKGYALADGAVALFRPEANAARFRDSAARLAMPEVSDELFIGAIEALVRADRAWVPDDGEGSLYLRPFMFANEAFLGVRPAKEYLFLVIASSVGGYFKSGRPAVKLWVSADYTRAAPGGTGAAKCGGNYAASLIAQAQAVEQDCDQVLFLDAAEHRWIEELGGMNFFVVMDDGSLVTPPLGGTILPGITRDSLIRLARDEGMTVREERYAFDQWQADVASGRVVESFACGTAAVVTPIGEVRWPEGGFTVGSGGPGQVATRLKQRLTDIQRGHAPDRFGWVRRIAGTGAEG